MNKLVETLLVYIPISILLLLAGAYLGGEIWAKGKIVLSDILKFFGWAGKAVRKFSIKSEYEGVINSIIQDYNKNFEDPILPSCKIEWVTSENKGNFLKDNQAIICLSFDKKDHNLNFYNATLNFVQTGLIAKAKDYLTASYSKAIDLLTTHIILRNNRREVLTTFRKKLNEFDDETKAEFESLSPTNERGLFLNILLPEFHHYGELVHTLPPSSVYRTEANGLFNWFKELATRDFDERTNLKFTSKNLKVGVILVAKSETWEAYGASAYTKWADYYASEGYNSVYILAKGSEGFERATAVTKILTHSKGFDQINKNPKIKCVSDEGKEYIVTCYSLRPNKATIAYLAWESFKSYYAEQKYVPAIIENIQKESITVNVFGLKFEILNSQLSEIEIIDARRTFKIEDELYLDIAEFDSEKQHIVLSNKGTATDPKHFIESVLNESKIYRCKVEKIQTDKQGLQTGLKVSNPELKSWIYIPKSKATTSRFLDLSIKYPLEKELDIYIENYSSIGANFVGSVANIENPWESETFKKLISGEKVNVIVKQINEFSVICEIAEGLECRFSQQEISWNFDECITSKFKIDDVIETRILSIDIEKKKIDVSPKQISKTPELEYYEENLNEVITVEIVKIIPEKGIVIKYPDGKDSGFLPWFEIGWGSVGHFEQIFKIGEHIDVVVYDFNTLKNKIGFSIKRKNKHDFEEWNALVDKDEVVEGQIIDYFENSVHVELTADNQIKVQAFIHKKFISDLAFIESNDMRYYLPIGELFQFNIHEISESRETISLTRIEFLNSLEEPQYGTKYDAKYVKENHKKAYFYSDELEGWMEFPENHIELGTPITLIPVSIPNKEYTIVS